LTLSWWQSTITVRVVMNYAERVVDYTAMKMMFNELCCGFGCAMNRTTIKAVCHISFIDLLDT
jgi:hypothetical protein